MRFRRERAGFTSERGPADQNQGRRLALATLSGLYSAYGISGGIRRKAESRSEAALGVGDGHSSVDGRDSITLQERRAVSWRELG